MSGVYEEERMKQYLTKYLPDGETLTAGIYGTANKSYIIKVFGNSAYDGEDNIVPAESGGAVKVRKSKRQSYSVYVGITQNSLIINECLKEMHYYEFNNVPADWNDRTVEYVGKPVLLSDIGKCFLLADIRKCVIKKGLTGSYKCFIEMKNGTYFKLTLPRRSGSGMPHQEEYRGAIIECLNKCAG